MDAVSLIEGSSCCDPLQEEWNKRHAILLGEKVGEIEGAELVGLKAGELMGTGEDLVAVRPRKATHVGKLGEQVHARRFAPERLVSRGKRCDDSTG